MVIYKVGDRINVRGYSELHTITYVNSAGYSTTYTTVFEGRPVEMQVSHVPFAYVV